MPQTKDLFANVAEGDNAALAARWDAFQTAMVEAPNTLKGDVTYGPSEAGVNVLTKTERASDQLSKLLGNADITKALGADTLASIQTQLEQANVQKDFTLTNPLNTGYVAYDLEAPAKLLFPKPTPLRNKFARTKGVGVAHQFKKIDGISGTQGGPKPVRPGITDTTSTQFGQLQLNRGPKIQYAGSETSIPYMQFGLSDSVPFSAQFAGQGFMDARATSRSSVLYASMLSEERMLLGGRGTASAFHGALAAPTGITLTARANAASETPLTGVTSNVYVKVTAASIFGESTLSAVASVAVAAGQVVDVTVPNVQGAVGYNVYVGTGAADPGDASRWLMASGGSNIITLQGALPTSGTAANTIAGDTSATATEYDGILTIAQGNESGYRGLVNGKLSTSNPGVEWQNAFAAMWQKNLADPEEVLFAGIDRKQLSDLLKTASSANYRIQISNDGQGNSLGNIVTGLQNEVTGSMVDLTVHPYMPQGNTAILSHTLPFADSNIDQLWSVKNVQDYMAIDWPVIQNSYDVSTYWFGTFFCYAPAWQGYVGRIQQG